MKIALIVIAVILLIFAILLFIPFFLVLEFSKKEEMSNFDVRIKYLFFNIKLNGKSDKKKKKTKSIDDKKDIEEKKDEKLIEKIKKGIDIFKNIEDDVVDILHYTSEKATTIRKLTFFLNFGFADPMSTGISTGALYGVSYNIISLLNNIFTVEECDVKINPDFERKHLDISSECILKLKTVHIIIIVFKVLKMYFKITKINRQL